MGAYAAIGARLKKAADDKVKNSYANQQKAQAGNAQDSGPKKPASVSNDSDSPGEQAAKFIGKKIRKYVSGKQ